MGDINKGDRVEWDWGNGTGTGSVAEVHTSEVTKRIKGAEVTRKANDDAPAFLIEQQDGSEVLKSMSEVRKA